MLRLPFKAPSNASQQHQNVTQHSQRCVKCLGYQPLKDMDNGEGRVEEIPQANCLEKVGKTISNYQCVWLGFSLWSIPQQLWVMMVYVGGVQNVWLKKYRLAEQLVSRVSRGKALPARYSRDTVVSTWHDSSHSSMCLAHDSLRGMLGRETPARILQSSNAWVFIHSFYHTTLTTNPTTNTRFKRLNIITIKFGTE